MSVASKTKPLSCIQVLCDHNSICNGFQRASEFDTHLAIFGAILTLLRTSSCESIYAPRHTSFQLKQISRAICTIPKSILLVDCQLPYNRYTRFRAENLIAVKTMIFFFYCCFKYFACCSSDRETVAAEGLVELVIKPYVSVLIPPWEVCARALASNAVLHGCSPPPAASLRQPAPPAL